MRILKLVLHLVLVCLIAAACSSDSDDSEPTAVATEAVSPPTEAAEEPAPEPNQAAVSLSAQQSELADAIFSALLEDDELPSIGGESRIRCLAEGLAGVFSDERLDELGLDGLAIAAAYEEEWNLWPFDEFGITEGEASEMVDRALQCADWRTALNELMLADGVPPEQAACFSSEVSETGLESLVADLLFGPGTSLVGPAGLAQEEMMLAMSACIDLRAFVFDSLVQDGGVSESSARCVVENMSDELIDAYFNIFNIDPEEPPEEPEAAQAVFAEFIELQNQCLTPEELEAIGGFGPSPDPAFDPGVGSQACPPADGSGPTVLDFDGSQPMCLDPTKQYTAVFDTTAGEMRITLDMANTPITANNFAVLARYRYYDDTLLFRTDPSIGIIQGGSPHTNSPSDPGPGYTIPDEGFGFAYEPGQIVMARTAAPNSAGAQFFFAVNENTALLNSQGTYVVFGQMDDASLAVAEAILASHVDQPDNPLGGGPEPPVIVNSVSIEETG